MSEYSDCVAVYDKAFHYEWVVVKRQLMNVKTARWLSVPVVVVLGVIVSLWVVAWAIPIQAALVWLEVKLNRQAVAAHTATQAAHHAVLDAIRRG